MIDLYRGEKQDAFRVIKYMKVEKYKVKDRMGKKKWEEEPHPLRIYETGGPPFLANGGKSEPHSLEGLGPHPWWREDKEATPLPIVV